MFYFAINTILNRCPRDAKLGSAFLTGNPFLTVSSAASIDSFDHCFLFAGLVGVFNTAGADLERSRFYPWVRLQNNKNNTKIHSFH